MGSRNNYKKSSEKKKIDQRDSRWIDNDAESLTAGRQI